MTPKSMTKSIPNKVKIHPKSLKNGTRIDQKSIKIDLESMEIESRGRPGTQIDKKSWKMRTNVVFHRFLVASGSHLGLKNGPKIDKKVKKSESVFWSIFKRRFLSILVDLWTLFNQKRS